MVNQVLANIIDNDGEKVNVCSGGLDVNVQDQTTPPVDTYFLKSISNFTLATDITASTLTGLVYTFTATAGHSLTVNDEIILLDTISDWEFYATVKGVATNVITVDRPIDHSFPAATSLGRKVTSQMAVDGSTTPQIFTVRAGTTPIDITRILFKIIDDSTMDDGKFGGITALTNGVVVRMVNSYQKSIFNFKTNGDIGNFCYDVTYTDATLGPAGNESLKARLTFAGQSKHGITLRLQDNDAVQVIIQDDLTDLVSFRIVAEGHQTTGET